MKKYKIDTLPNDINAPPSLSPGRGYEKTTPTQKATPSQPVNVTKDPLIATGWEKVVYSLSILLFLGLVIFTGLINRKLEYALLFALVISLVAVALFFII